MSRGVDGAKRQKRGSTGLLGQSVDGYQQADCYDYM